MKCCRGVSEILIGLGARWPGEKATECNLLHLQLLGSYFVIPSKCDARMPFLSLYSLVQFPSFFVKS
jgi:hypothetical protein